MIMIIIIIFCMFIIKKGEEGAEMQLLSLYKAT